MGACSPMSMIQTVMIGIDEGGLAPALSAVNKASILSRAPIVEGWHGDCRSDVQPGGAAETVRASPSGLVRLTSVYVWWDVGSRNPAGSSQALRSLAGDALKLLLARALSHGLASRGEQDRFRRPGFLVAGMAFHNFVVSDRCCASARRCCLSVGCRPGRRSCSPFFLSRQGFGSGAASRRHSAPGHARWVALALLV